MKSKIKSEHFFAKLIGCKNRTFNWEKKIFILGRYFKIDIKKIFIDLLQENVISKKWYLTKDLEIFNTNIFDKIYYHVKYKNRKIIIKWQWFYRLLMYKYIIKNKYFQNRNIHEANNTIRINNKILLRKISKFFLFKDKVNFFLLKYLSKFFTKNFSILKIAFTLLPENVFHIKYKIITTSNLDFKFFLKTKFILNTNMYEYIY
ncbi:hypothetical protein [Guillardia theta]|uniref:Uncharacterized protein n=1 Tax=Guillardia theta TaxID=55529 RepID=Q9AVW5_GUITH|nr:hypothetical protein GTHECHR2186 [Guillardia theta]CAC27106.1 hypothetical protein [Guillardia theta]